MKTMKFVHPETGLELIVTESREQYLLESVNGSIQCVSGPAEFETDCGQKCVPASTDDVHQLLAVEVLTIKGRIKLIRCF